MKISDIPQNVSRRILLNLYTPIEKEQGLDTKLNLIFNKDLDLIRVYRLQEVRKELLEKERKRLERKALYGKRRRKQLFKLHESGFYKSYLQEDKIVVLLDEKTRDAKTFRRKFRVPYIIFMKIVDEISNSTDSRWNCLKTQRNEISESAGADPIPHTILVLCSLRILGRNLFPDDVHDLCGVSETKIRNYFRDFVMIYGSYLFKKLVKAPSPNDMDELNKCMYPYKIVGLPGCIASVDCVHVQWEAPNFLKHSCANGRFGGKLKTMVFQVAVSNDRKILSATQAFYGTMNDTVVARYDSFVQDVLKGVYRNVNYQMYNERGQKREHAGCWLLVDGGYSKSYPHLQYPVSCSSMNLDNYQLSKHKESVRKDVECCFGILKKRFLILKTSIRSTREEITAPIFHTCCALHNWLLHHDEVTLVTDASGVNGMEYPSDSESDSDDEDKPNPFYKSHNNDYIRRLTYPEDMDGYEDSDDNTDGDGSVLQLGRMTNNEFRGHLRNNFKEQKIKEGIKWSKYSRKKWR